MLCCAQLLENAAGVVGNSGDLTAQFDAAAANNLTVVRVFGFGTAGGFQLQYSPGSYNEKAFQAFDKVPNLWLYCYLSSDLCTLQSSLMSVCWVQCARSSGIFLVLHVM